MNVELLTVPEGTHWVMWRCICALAAFKCSAGVRVDSISVPKVATINLQDQRSGLKGVTGRLGLHRLV
jgi:hypothetical protein